REGPVARHQPRRRTVAVSRQWTRFDVIEALGQTAGAIPVRALEGWQSGNASVSNAVAGARVPRGFDPLALRFPWDGNGARRQPASTGSRISPSWMRPQRREAWLPTRRRRVRPPESARCRSPRPTRARIAQQVTAP